MPYNTRLFKHGTSGSVSYELRLASVARNGKYIFVDWQPSNWHLIKGFTSFVMMCR